MQFICSIAFVNCTEGIKLVISLQSKLNVKASSWQLKPDSSQTYQHKTDRLTPESTIALFAFLATRVSTVRT
jgi:hypothetical protein